MNAEEAYSPRFYLEYMTLHPATTFVLAAIAFLGLYVVINTTPMFSKLFVVSTFAIVLWHYYTIYQPSYTQWYASKTQIDAAKVDSNQDLVFNDIYKISRPPKTIKYILKHDDLNESVNVLFILNRYDKAAYDRIITLLEEFLKLYDRISLKKIDCVSNLPIMQTLRSELLNELSRIHLNIPDSYNKSILTATRTIQSVTYRCFKVASIYCDKKHRKLFLAYKPPYANDPFKSIHDLF